MADVDVINDGNAHGGAAIMSALTHGRGHEDDMDSRSDENDDLDDRSQINNHLNHNNKASDKNDELFFDANDGDDNDQDDVDDDDDEDLIDDDMIDDEARIEKEAIDKAASFDSESNESPLVNQKKIRSLRHAATLATEGREHNGQNFESEARTKQARGSSHPLGSSHTSKIVTTKKTKLMAIHEPSNDAGGSNEQYSPRNVVAKMLMKKDRKIPGSVYKPHSEEIILLQSVALG